MMTKLKFEKINGHQPTVDRVGDRFVAACWCECSGDSRVFLTSDVSRDESGALKSLVECVFRHHGRIVMAKAGWACEPCGRVTALQAHHRKLRSHGRDDRVANLQSICGRCHEKVHRVDTKEG